jgi:hypothetical protein
MDPFSAVRLMNRKHLLLKQFILKYLHICKVHYMFLLHEVHIYITLLLLIHVTYFLFNNKSY